MMRPSFESPLDYQQQQISKIVRSPPPTIIGPPNGQTCVSKIMIGLDHAPPSFNLRSRIIGDGGTNLNYIRSETGAMVTLRGRGSLFIDPTSGTEAAEPMNLHIEHPVLDGLNDAKQLVKNLVETLQEELNFFQENNAAKQNFQLVPQPALIQSTPAPQMPPVIRGPHVSQPNGIITQPPPPVLSQQHYANIPQNQPPPQQLLQQPALIQQHVPVQIHQQQNGMLISQLQPQQMGQVNNPPPGTPIRAQGPIVQLKGPSPNQHLSQPPPNIQIQPQQQQQQQQILVNHQGGPYQLQYIQPNGQIQANNGQHPGQVTIQHLQLQPQQQIQGIMQSSIPQQFEQFQRPQGQQIITVNGSTAFMVPPPNLMQQTQSSSVNQNIIFQQQQPILNHPPPTEISHIVQHHSNDGSMKDDKKPHDNDNRGSVKCDEHGNVMQQMSKNLMPPTSIPLNQPPPPIMSMPPPNVQHIIGNTLITTQANQQLNQQMPQQIYSQIPVSIQSFQPSHQIQVNGSHFLVNSQQWQQNTHQQQHIQQVQTNNGVQNIQFTTQALRNPNDILIGNPTIINGPSEYRPQQQIITSTAFNPQMQPPAGVQVQFHPVPPPQQMIQSIPNPPHMIEQQQQHQQQQQQQPQIINNNGPPPPFNAVQYSQQENKFMDHPRPGQKRKMAEDDSQKNIPSKIGMGSNNGGNLLSKQRVGNEHRASNMATKSSNGGMLSTASSLATPAGSAIAQSSNTADEPKSDYNKSGNPSSSEQGVEPTDNSSPEDNSRQRTSNFRLNQPYYANNNTGSTNNTNRNPSNYQNNGNYQRNFESSPPPTTPRYRW